MNKIIHVIGIDHEGEEGFEVVQAFIHKPDAERMAAQIYTQHRPCYIRTMHYEDALGRFVWTQPAKDKGEVG